MDSGWAHASRVNTSEVRVAGHGNTDRGRHKAPQPCEPGQEADRGVGAEGRGVGVGSLSKTPFEVGRGAGAGAGAGAEDVGTGG